MRKVSPMASKILFFSSVVISELFVVLATCWRDTIQLYDIIQITESLLNSQYAKPFLSNSLKITCTYRYVTVFSVRITYTKYEHVFILVWHSTITLRVSSQWRDVHSKQCNFNQLNQLFYWSFILWILTYNNSNDKFYRFWRLLTNHSWISYKAFLRFPGHF